MEMDPTPTEAKDIWLVLKRRKTESDDLVQSPVAGQLPQALQGTWGRQHDAGLCTSAIISSLKHMAEEERAAANVKLNCNDDTVSDTDNNKDDAPTSCCVVQ